MEIDMSWSRKFEEPDRDDDFFKDINSPIKAYLSGLFGSDGCLKHDRRVGRQSWQLAIELLNSDRHVIEHLAAAIKLDKDRIKVYKARSENRHEMASLRFAITSDRKQDKGTNMLRDVMRLGIVQNKTKIYNPPIEFLNEYAPYFWSGMTDGDGHFEIDDKNNCYRFGLTGNWNTCNELRKYACKIVPNLETYNFKGTIPDVQTLKHKWNGTEKHFRNWTKKAPWQDPDSNIDVDPRDQGQLRTYFKKHVVGTQRYDDSYRIVFSGYQAVEIVKVIFGPRIKLFNARKKLEDANTEEEEAAAKKEVAAADVDGSFGMERKTEDAAKLVTWQIKRPEKFKVFPYPKNQDATN